MRVGFYLVGTGRYGGEEFAVIVAVADLVNEVDALGRVDEFGLVVGGELEVVLKYKEAGSEIYGCVLDLHTLGG